MRWTREGIEGIRHYHVYHRGRYKKNTTQDAQPGINRASIPGKEDEGDPRSRSIRGLGSFARLLDFLKHLLKLRTTGLLVRPVVDRDVVPEMDVSIRISQ